MRRLTLIVFAAALCALSLAAPVASAQTTPSPASSPIDLSLAECERADDDATLQAELAAQARATMRETTAAIDYRALVLSSWRAIDYDAKFERLVDAKIDVMRSDRSYFERLLDGNIPSRAEEMATRTAALVFESEEFDALQKELGAEISAGLEPAISRADLAVRTHAARCVQGYLDQRYAALVSGVFADDVSDATFSLDANLGAGASATINLAGVLAAMMVVVFRRVVRRVVASIVRRLAGAIAARLAAWVSVALGAALLIYELVAGADGVFPVIRAELVGDETRIELQNGVVEALSDVGADELEARAQAIAEAIFARWRAFKDAHRAMLALADEEPRFRRFLEDQPRDRFDDLTVITSSLIKDGGSRAVMEALDRGVLASAMQIPGIGRHLEAWSPRGVGLEALLAWAEKAGTAFERVLQLELPAETAADSFTADDLAKALALDDRQATRLAAALGGEARRDYLASPRSTALQLAERFDAPETARLLTLSRLARTDVMRGVLVERGIETPGLVRRLSATDVAAAEASAAPWKAAEILLDPAPIWNLGALSGNLSSIWAGDVSPLLLWSRYGWWSALFYGPPALLGFIVIRRVARLFRPRRRSAEATR